MVTARGGPRVTIEPLTENRFEDLAGLFMEGGDPKWCWCMYFRTAGVSWSNSTPKQNREGLRTLAGEDPAPGLVAYKEGSALGWVGLGPRDSYDRLGSSKLLAPLDDKPVWSIVCFVVSARNRKQGIALMLLDGVIEYARQNGATTLESYPLSSTRGRVAPSSAYHGSQSMFEKAGFTVVEVRQWNKTSPQRPIMRLELA